MVNTSVVPGSLAAVAEQSGQSLAESFLSASVIILFDSSGSMDEHDAPGGRTRYAMACDELKRVQASNPGKVAVVAFSSTVQFIPGGHPPFFGGGTDLAAALEFVKIADGTVKFIVISDGMPNDPSRALHLADTFSSEISCIYTGPENDPTGRHFLQQLAKAGRGKSLESLRTSGLADSVETLMLGTGR